MDLSDIEGDASALTRMARLDPSEAHSIRSLCVGLTGHPPIVAPLIGSQGQTLRVKDATRIAVSSRLSPQRQRWVAGHELAHVYFQRIGYAEPDLEARCDLLGAILCAPRKVVQEARREHGDRPHAIAKAIGVTQALALLRLGEVGAVGGAALATATRVVARGEIVWPDSDTLRRVIRGGKVQGGRRVRITDEPSRGGLIILGE